MNAIQKMQADGIRDSLLANGFYPIPCKPNKEPRDGYHVKERLWDGDSNPVYIPYEAEAGSLLTAVRLVHGLSCIDVDVLDAFVSKQVEQLAIQHFGKTAVRARENTSKVALFYRAKFCFPKLVQTRKRMQIELRQQSLDSSSSFYQLVDGSTEEGRYFYRGAHLKDCRLQHLPEITEAQMLAFLSACEPLTGLSIKEERPTRSEPSVSFPEASEGSRSIAKAKAGAMLTKLAAWPESELAEKHPHRYHAMNAVAQVLGGYVAAGNLDYADASNWTLWAMEQNGYLAKHHRQSANYVLNLIRRGLEHGMKTPLAIEESEVLQSVKAFCKSYDPKPRLKHIIASIEDVPDVLELEDEPIQWIIPGLVAAGAITMLVGSAGCGKSSFISAMSSHIANGTNFLNLPAFQNRPCLYLDRENSKSFVQARLRRLHCQTGPNFKYLGGWLGEYPEPESPMVKDWVERQTIAPVIFLDSAVRFIDGNENSTEDVRDFMAKLRWFADRGAAVVFLHHTGKGESTQQGRGAYDFTAASDFAFTMHNAGETLLTDITIRSTKQRERQEFSSKVHYCNGTFSVDGIVSHRENTQPLLGYLQENPDMKTTAFIAEAMVRFGLSRDPLREWLRMSIAAGMVTEISGANGAKLLRAKGSVPAPQETFNVVQ